MFRLHEIRRLFVSVQMTYLIDVPILRPSSGAIILISSQIKVYRFIIPRRLRVIKETVTMAPGALQYEWRRPRDLPTAALPSRR